MFPVLTVIFLVVPIAEIYLLIQMGQVIGAPWTILLVVLTAVIGVRLLKIQGVSTLMRAQQKMQSGQAPAQEMLEGLGLVLAGAFLLTPGFFTDTLGFLLLIPPTRAWLVSRLVAKMMASSRFSGQVHAPGFDQNGQPARKRDPNIIEDVNYTRDD